MAALRVERLALQHANGIVVAAASRLTAAPTTSLPQLQLPQRRPFGHSPLFLRNPQSNKAAGQAGYDRGKIKKKNSNKNSAAPKGRGAAEEEAEEDDSSKHPKPSPNDPLDLTDLTSRWSAIESHHRTSLKQLSAGGRFNPDTLGALPVAPDPKKAPGERYPLRELAQVVPRAGRTISLLANDKAHLKPIIDAVQASPDYNQQPQHAPDNELELLMRVEPERKGDLEAKAMSIALAWRERVRKESEKRKKIITKWLALKEIGPDMKRKIESEVQKAQNKVLAVVDQAEKEAMQKIK